MRRKEASKTAEDAYKSVMAASLAPVLYQERVAQDTIEGRFSMTALHGALAMRRLRTAGEPGRVLAAALQKRLFSGFDYALRETGVGDSSIARKARRLGEEFYGLARAIDSALSDETDDGLARALERNGLGGGRSRDLALYVRSCADALHDAGDADVLRGQFPWASFHGSSVSG
ncbi:MAG: ubiquinol-cytochrome C chaperone family protein [Pseudomonadota bacterium]